MLTVTLGGIVSLASFEAGLASALASPLASALASAFGSALASALTAALGSALMVAREVFFGYSLIGCLSVT
jgi:hypothetical protein